MKTSKIGRKITLQQGELTVTIIEFGARVASIRYKNKEMLVSYPRLEQLASDPFALGATCGRVANRIAGAKYTYEKKTIQLIANDGEHCLHGGVKNFANQLWQVSEFNQDKQSVKLSLHSPDGDQGFPGEVLACVEYRLINNALEMSFSAHTNQTTPIDLTNHCYFNLAEENCLDLNLTINANHYLPKTSKNVPNGEIKKLNHQQQIAGIKLQKTLENWQQDKLITERGFDHYFPFANNTPTTPQAILQSNKNNIEMRLYSDQLGLQLYTAGWLGRPFKTFAGVCLEAQNYPNAVNFPQFPSPFITPKETYNKVITFAFSSLAANA